MPSRRAYWGNSLGLRLPRHVAEVAGVRAGDYLYVRVADSGEIIVTPVKPQDMPALKPTKPKSGPSCEIEKW